MFDASDLGWLFLATALCLVSGHVDAQALDVPAAEVIASDIAFSLYWVALYITLPIMFGLGFIGGRLR